MNSYELETEIRRVRSVFSGPTAVLKMLSKKVPDFDKALYWYSTIIRPTKGLNYSLLKRAFNTHFKLEHAAFNVKLEPVSSDENSRTQFDTVDFNTLPDMVRNQIIMKKLEPIFYAHDLICAYGTTYPFSSSLPCIKTSDNYAHHNEFNIFMYDLSTSTKVEFENYIYIRGKEDRSDSIMVKIGTKDFDSIAIHTLLRELAVDTTHANVKDIKYQVFSPERFKKVYDLCDVNFDYFTYMTISYHLKNRSLEPAVVQQLLTPCLSIFVSPDKINTAFALYDLSGELSVLLGGLSNTDTVNPIQAAELPELGTDFELN